MGAWLAAFRHLVLVADFLGVMLALTATLVGAGLPQLYGVRDIDASGPAATGFYTFLLLIDGGCRRCLPDRRCLQPLYVWFEVFLISAFGLIVLGSEARQLDGAVEICRPNLIATTLFP